MPKRTVFSLFQFVIAVCLFGIAASAQADSGKPIAAVEIDTYDFGPAFEGSDITHDFIIKNIGDAKLEIQTVKTG